MKLKNIINSYLEKYNFFILYRFGPAIGDQLLMTGLVKLIKSKYNYKILVFTSYPELFFNNPNIYKVYSFNKIFSIFIYKIFKYLDILRIKEFLYTSSYKKIEGIFDLSNYKNIHLAEYHSNNIKLVLNFINYKNEFFFSADEIIRFDKDLNLPKRFSVIQPVGKTSFTPNKEWGFFKFQEVVNKLKNITWVQLGTQDQKELSNIRKFYSNLNLRQLAYVIYRSDFMLCLEGLYNHLGNCFNKKTFLILSGFVSEKNIKYSNNILIKKFDHLECYPCYRLHDCNIKNKPCTNLITSDEVVEVIKNNLN
jgi:ADP-heptose:LPS heptosyltransferase